MAEYIQQLFHQVAEHPWLFSFLIIICTFILEDPTTIAVGSFVSLGHLSFMRGFLSLFIGIVVGDIGLYYIGKFIRSGIWKEKEPSPWLEEKIHSSSLLFTARFVPGMRVTYYTAAGFFNVPMGKFFWINFISCFIWVFLLLWTSHSVFYFLFQILGIHTIWLIPVVIIAVWRIEARLSNRALVRDLPEVTDHDIPHS